MRRFLSFFLLILILFSFVGCGQSKAEKEATSKISLDVWAVFEDEEAMENLMDAYRRVHSNVSFNLRLLRYNEYEDELWRAFAVGEGPDIFSIHNTWIGEYKDLITPLPSTLSIPYTETKGTIKKETVTVLRTEKTLTKQELKTNFVDVVYDDVLRSYQPNPDEEAADKIFALPFALDTLVLYSNTDLLNNANIPEPPTTWEEFQDQVKTITKINEKGEIASSAAALGTGNNIERSSDILSVLMLQTGTSMEKDREAVFASSEENLSTSLDALRFYTDFANPVKEVYTWNPEMPNSFEAFTQGETAFFFGYAYHQPLIKAQAPKLNYRISALPQIGDSSGTISKVVNFANYWVWTVAKSSKNSKWAWDFIQFASKKDNVNDYLTASKRPTALRSLINTQAENPDLSVFVSQVLTAESWYHGKDAGVVETAFSNLIDETLNGDNELMDLIKEAQNKINQTY